MKSFLNKNVETLLCGFWEFSNKSEKLLAKFNITDLPIDIQNFAKRSGCQIKYTHYPSFSKRFIGYATTNTIEVDADLMYKEKRWVIAKSLANNIVNDRAAILIPNPFLIAPNPDEVVLDVLAMLLLFPISKFEEEISKNIGKTGLYIGEEGNNLLQYLSDKSQISEFHIAFGYPIMEQMLSFKRNKEFKESNYDIMRVTSNQYENIFL